MSIQSEIDRIEQNIANTYTALSELGADMPTQQNSDNLPGTAESVKAVLYTAQTLTEEQKAQARSNIGAGQPVLEVTITQNEDGSYASSHTRKQIFDAFRAGRLPVASVGTEIYRLAVTAVGIARFVSFVGNIKKELLINISGTVSITESEIALMSDIPDVNNVSMKPFYLILGDPAEAGDGLPVLGGYEGELTDADGTHYEGVESAMAAMEAAYTAGKAVFVMSSNPAEGIPAPFPLESLDEGFAIFAVNQWNFRLEVIVQDGMGYLSDMEFLTPEDVPQTLPNPFALTFTGAVTGSYDGSDAKTVNIPKVPVSLKNPYALTINGTSYDGSAAVNLTIEGGSGEAIPDYVRTEAERVAAVVQSHQNENTFTAILSSDYHIPAPSHTYYEQILASITHAGQAMSILREQIHRDFDAMLGDTPWDAGETREETMTNFRLVHSLISEQGGIDEVEGVGNHDHLHSNATPFTDAQIYPNIGIYNKGWVRDPVNRVGGYCYKDYEEYKLRVILLNTSETDDGSFFLSAQQITWLGSALAVQGENGWSTLILSHHPLDWGGSNTAVMQTIKAATGILANLHGHVHTYTQGVITGTSIPRLAIPNVCFYRNNEYGQNGGPENAEGIEFGTTVTYNKTANSAEDTAFCVMTLDREAGKLYLDHYGAGIDREQDVGNWKVSGYTNLVPTSQAADSTEPYNGAGYKNGVYLSSSGGDSSDTDTVATGYIPYTWLAGNVLYVKGADVTSTSHVRIYGYTAKGAAPSSSAMCSGPTLATYFTVETLGDNYYKLTTLNNVGQIAYLRLSLVGTGENLIVTVNEPIE